MATPDPAAPAPPPAEPTPPEDPGTVLRKAIDALASLEARITALEATVKPDLEARVATMEGYFRNLHR